MLPLAKFHINTSPTAALGGRSPYWARYGVNPNVSQLPPLEDVFKLMGFSRCWVARAWHAMQQSSFFRLTSDWAAPCMCTWPTRAMRPCSPQSPVWPSW